MNTLREAVHEYLSMRRHLGFKLRAAGNALLDFTHFMEQRQAPFITETWALAWAQQPQECPTRALGATVGRRAGLCALSQGHRPAHGGSIPWVAALSAPAGKTVSVLG